MEIVINTKLMNNVKFSYSSEKEDLKLKIYNELQTNPRDIRIEDNNVKIYTGDKNIFQDNSDTIGEIISNHFGSEITRIKIQIE